MDKSDSAPVTGPFVTGGEKKPRLATLDQSVVDRFCCQYLQLEARLDYPDGRLLKRADVQDEIFQRIYADYEQADSPARNPRFQLRTLKELVGRIQASIGDEEADEYEVSDKIMDRLGHLVSMPQVPEADMAQMKSLVTYRLSLLQPPVQIDILENRSLIAAGGTTGLRTWEAGLHLGQFLCANRSLVTGKRILELGAGTGYLSILCAKFLGAAHVTASDGSAEIVDNLPDNLALNDIPWSYNASSDTIISPKLLKWGHALVGTEESEWNGGRVVDVIIGADITYDQRAHQPLVATLKELLELYPDAEIVIAATQRTLATHAAFQDACRLCRLKLSELRFSDDEMLEKLVELGQHHEPLTPFYAKNMPIHIFQISASV